MFRQFSSPLTFATVLAITYIASIQPSQAQVLRKFFEGAPESKPATSGSDNRTAPNPRQPNGTNSQTNRNGYGPSTQGRAAQSNPAPRPQPNQTQRPQPKSNIPQQATRPPQSSASNQRSQVPGQQPGSQSPSQMNRAPSSLQRPTSRVAIPETAGNRPIAPTAPFQASPIEPPKRNSPSRSFLSDRDGDRTNPALTRLEEQEGGTGRSLKPADSKEVLRRFGLNLVERDDHLVVVQVDGSGNASEAGLQKGDSIVSLGGAPISNQNEFTEIAGLLSEGDQIELVLSRNGEEEKAFIQYGQAHEMPPESESSDSSKLRLQDSTWTATSQAGEVGKLKQIVEQQRSVIAELQERIRELESSRGKSAF